jgi:hypothetical protein
VIRPNPGFRLFATTTHHWPLAIRPASIMARRPSIRASSTAGTS